MKLLPMPRAPKSKSLKARQKYRDELKRVAIHNAEILKKEKKLNKKPEETYDDINAEIRELKETAVYGKKKRRKPMNGSGSGSKPWIV